MLKKILLFSTLLTFNWNFPFICSLAYAEFIQTSPAVYQSSDLKTKVIASDKGILVVRSNEIIPLQKFDPSTLMSKGTYNLFIKYDPKRNFFTHILSNEKEYQIKGSLGIDVDGIRVRIDNYSNPYLTIVTDSNSQKPSILGFLALSAVVNFSSNEAVALLEGNQSFSEVSDINPYTINTKGEISLKAEKLNTNILGLNIPLPNNPCLKQNNPIFISESIFKKVTEITEIDKRSEVIASIIKLKKQSDFLSKLIILKAQKSIIAFEPNQNSLFNIKPTSLDPENEIGEQIFCVYQKIEFN